jgi:AcrR family transcriptional regulator
VSDPAPELPLRPPRVREIISAARQVLEAEGAAELTMRRLGDVVGIRAPSIYKHLPGKHAVEVALIESGLLEMGQALREALDESRPDSAVPDLLAGYRRQARAHPNLYRLATAGRLPRSELTLGLEEWAGRPWFVVTGDPYVAQALWSFAHGMVSLELDHRYPEASDVDRTWTAGAKAFAAGGARRRARQRAPTAR